MMVEDVRSGFISEGVSRNFSMQAAMKVIDDLRAGKPAVIHIDENDPRIDQ